MNRYHIYCTPDQTKKALELGAPVLAQPDALGNRTWLKVTAEQMLGFLRSKNIQFHFDDETNYWSIEDATDDLTPLRWYGRSNNKELDAIDAALDYLTKNKK